MIQPSELRIGNLVSISDTPCAVRAIYEDGQVQLEYKYNSSGEVKTSLVISMSFDGIPLTPEWLERMGFVADGVEGIYMAYEQDGLKIWHDVHKNSFIVDNIKTLKVAPKYVHELQNVMFALSGRELEVKP